MGGDEVMRVGPPGWDECLHTVHPRVHPCAMWGHSEETVHSELCKTPSTVQQLRAMETVHAANHWYGKQPESLWTEKGHNPGVSTQCSELARERTKGGQNP